jgi:hypothetical protein
MAEPAFPHPFELKRPDDRNGRLPAAVVGIREPVRWDPQVEMEVEIAASQELRADRRNRGASLKTGNAA